MPDEWFLSYVLSNKPSFKKLCKAEINTHKKILSQAFKSNHSYSLHAYRGTKK